MALYLGHGLGPRADLELLIDVADVEVDRVTADRKLVGDFLVEKPLTRRSSTSCSRVVSSTSPAFGSSAGAGFLKAWTTRRAIFAVIGEPPAITVAGGGDQFAALTGFCR